MSRPCRPGEGPPNVPRVRSAQDAGRAIYTTFGEVPEHVESTAWGDYFVISRSERGQNVRIVQAQRSPATHIEYRNFSDRRAASAHDSQPNQRRDDMDQGSNFPGKSMITAMRTPSWGSAPVILNTRMPSAPQPKTVTPDAPTERLALKQLDELGATLLALDPTFMSDLVVFDKKIRKGLAARVKERQAQAQSEFDRLTGEGRAALERLQRLQDEKSELQESLNRRVAARNGASQRYQSVRRSKPSDSTFATREEFDQWEVRMNEAKAAFDAAEAQADELRAAIRTKTAAITIAKVELSELRARRESARKRAGLAPAGESQDVTAEFLSVQG